MITIIKHSSVKYKTRLNLDIIFDRSQLLIFYQQLVINFCKVNYVLNGCNSHILTNDFN